MQDRYAGDIGDYIKLALLRSLAPGRDLGVAWYLYPDEQHNSDGKHVSYLDNSDRWKSLDPDLFEAMRELRSGKRTVARIQDSGILKATYFAVPVPDEHVPPGGRSEARREWFSNALAAFRACDLVFADPDNGLTDNRQERRRKRTFGKQLPLSEAQGLAQGRSAIIYHHNSRFPGGHDLEVDYWLKELGNAVAIRANAFSCRAFFIVNPDAELLERSREFCARWANHRVWLSEARVHGLNRAA